jgi:hypothetical protein
MTLKFKKSHAIIVLSMAIGLIAFVLISRFNRSTVNVWDQIQPGQTYEEVTSILGPPNQPKLRTAKDDLVIEYWDKKINGKVIEISFRDGIVIEKNQIAFLQMSLFERLTHMLGN